jgi:glucokinase
VRVVGVDVGGSKLAAAVVDLRDGSCGRLLTRPTAPERGGAAVLADCGALARSASGDDRLPVGVGLCEFVEPAGRIESGVTVEWRGLDLAGAFAPLGPVRVESDVRAAALAEARFGAGVGLAAFLYLTVGTGVSFCHVVGGVPYPGARGHAIVVGAPPVEHVGGGKALAERAGVADAAAALGDPAHARVVEEGARAVGAGLAALVNAFDPDAVVVGGGLGRVEAYRARLVDHARTLIDGEGVRGLPVVPAALGERSGVVGAALAAVG